MIAKVLQNLSNGVLFGSKEAYFETMNHFVQESFPRMDRFFDKITDVEDVEEAMAMDQFLLIDTVELTQDKTIKISFNEIMQMHALVKNNSKDLVIQEDGQDDPVAKILDKLGKINQEVPRSENTTFTLVLNTLCEGGGGGGGDGGTRGGAGGADKKQMGTRGPRLSVWESKINTRGRAVSKANEMSALMKGKRLSGDGENEEEVRENRQK